MNKRPKRLRLNKNKEACTKGGPGYGRGGARGQGKGRKTPRRQNAPR